MSELTVIVPVWDDYCSFLPECLESVLAQELALRVIVVENASTAPLPDPPPDVEVVHSERRLSVGAARNLGLARVETPFVCFVDADDRVLPRAFRFLVGELRAHPEQIAAATRLLAWNPETGERRPFGFPRDHVYRLTGRRLPLALYQLGRSALQLGTCTVMRTEAVQDAGGFGDANYAEDWCLATALAFRGPIGLHRRPGSLYRQHPDSLRVSGTRRDVYRRSLRELRARVRRDPRVPLLVKAALPGLAVLHGLKAHVQARAEARG